jgi:succinate dehydrogenase / fumarate reductase flavoprotein subunit
MKLDPKVPGGPLAEKWDKHRFDSKLVNPANKRKFDIIVVGAGLAGASASASLAELGYNVKTFCLQDSPRRAHSIAAQGGINAAKNYQNDGDSIFRLFYDTIKGGDFRAREANVYRLAQVSNNIIDQCVAQGVPFAREYGGQLANRSFGGAQVSRTFYARGQTGQQLLLGAYSALMRQVKKGKVEMLSRREMLDMQWYWQPAATVMPTSCPPMPWVPMSLQPGGHIKKAPALPTPVLYRSIPPASRCTAAINPSLP